MPEQVVDLRSDTVTRPTPEMRRAIAEAEVGDDVFGDDPTVKRLQEEVAEIFGKEAALFVPSGTMANQIAIGCHTRPGDEVYGDAGAHIFNYESGAPAALWGVTFHPIPGRNGTFTAEEVKARLRPPQSHFPQSRLIWVENSHNRAGGTIFPQEEVLRLRQLATEEGLGLHLDGARIWNVAVAVGKSERELAEPFDSLTCCLSKGLGCPVGSLVVGTKEFIARAHRLRKRLGGGMRQVGILAAAGLYALRHHRQRLIEDHRRARALAEGIAELGSFSIDLSTVQTNIVIFDVSPLTGSEVVERLKAEGVLCTAFGSKVRMVTHLNIDDQDIDYTLRTIHRIFGREHH